MLQSLPVVIKMLVSHALYDALETIIQSRDPDSNAPKSQTQSKSNGTEPTNVAYQKSSYDLLNFTSEMKTAFSEASQSLNLFESYLKKPNQETVERLELSFDRGKNVCDELFKADNIDRVLHYLRKTKKCPQDDNNERKKSNDLDSDSPNFENIELEDKLDSYSKISSVFKESSKLETRKIRFESTGNPGNKPDIIGDNFMQSSQIGKQMLEKRIGKNPSSKEDSRIPKKEDFLFCELQHSEKTIMELEKENHFLQKQLESLTVKNHQYEEILFEFGKSTVEETAKRNEERKSKIFHQIYNTPSSGAKQSLTSTSNGTPINDLPSPSKDCHDGAQAKKVPASHFSNFEITTANINGHPPILISASHSAAFNENPARQDETLLQGSVSSTVSGNREISTPTTPNPSVIESTEKANGGNVSKQLGDDGAASNIGMTSQQNYDDLSFSVQQHDSGMESITLANKPATSVATTLYNNYKLFLLTLAQRLLSSEVVVLKDWAAQNFSIVNPENATDVFFQLDEKHVINASDLGRLCKFFESIVRFDLVYIVDAFLLGDYSLLRHNPASKNRSTNAAQNSRHRSISSSMNHGQYSVHPAAPGIILLARKPENNGGAQNTVPQQKQQGTSLSLLNTGNPKPFSRFVNDNHSITAEQQNPMPLSTEFTSHRKIDAGVTEGPVIRETMALNSTTRTNPSTKNSQSVISNGSKLSKFQRPDTERTNVYNLQSRDSPRHQNLDQDDNWLCSHYKRHCYVKFECCDKFWPCHRCHNNQSTCGRKKLKSRDTRMLKCVYCHKVQEFGEHCCNCGAKFANYYCGLCKHLTGKDDHPYHCEKCGICRIHGDRSFHCDVCGVCLDVQLRGNHKCREGSAHDECCICLEDAFTGCQILPCSHKVHKECATQMIRSGITRCPICRESFAHKLERRPFPTSQKRPGK